MAADVPLDPDDVARKSFTSAFRGFEQQEVRSYLHELAEAIRAVDSRRFELEARIAELEPQAATRDRPIDEGRLIEMVGEETARVLEAARNAADEIREKAEATAARLLHEATDEAAARRTEAEAEAIELLEQATTELERQSAEAEVEAAKILDRAERDAAETRAEAGAQLESASAEAEEVRAEAEAVAAALVEEAREQGRTMLHEAQAVRERVLRDLARRRRVARSQVERLNAGRERLLAAYDVVRRTLGEATDELTTVVGEARLAADNAARRVDEEDEATVEELEAELAAGRLVDLPLLVPDALEPVGDELDVDAVDDQIDEQGPGDGIDAEVDRDDEVDEPADSASRSDASDASDDALPEIDLTTDQSTDEAWSELDTPEPVEDPPQPILMPHRPARRRGLLRRPDRPAEPRLPPAELVPLQERHRVEEVRVVGDTEPAVAGTGSVLAGESDGAAVPARVEELFARIRAGRVDATTGDEPVELSDASVEAIVDTVVDTIVDELGADHDDPAADVAVADSGEVVDDIDDEDTVEGVAVEIGDVEADPAAVAQTTRDEALAPLGRDLGKRLKRVLADEQNELLDQLRRSGEFDLDTLVGTADEHAARYATVAVDVLSEAATLGAAEAGTKMTPDCREVAWKLAAALTAPLRDRVERAAEQATGDVDELDARLRACYREWKTGHLSDASTDALVAAWSFGIVEGAPTGCGLRWLVAPHGQPCPDADDNALGGVVTPGAEFPTGDAYPPAHPGCRCLVVRVSQ